MLARALATACVVGVAVAAIPAAARACSCLPPDIARSYNAADEVVTARIGGRIRVPSDPSNVYYRARVRRVWKGCLEARDRILVRTPASSAACGVGFERHGVYYLNGHAAGGHHRLPVLDVNLCDYNRPARALTLSDHEFLLGRLNCCGEVCACNDGTEPVLCIVAPCSVSTCDVPDASCVSNYCGGCHAEWYDVTGARVCDD